MILSALVIVIMLACAALWGSKAKGYGLFSAMLAMICTVAAGAVAFGVWEPTAGLLLGISAKLSGTGAALIEGSAWGLGLLLPFILSLLIFRVLVDSIVKANLEFSDSANQMGGLVLGAVIGMITSGMIVLSIGYMNLPPKLLGYQPLEDQRGNLVYKSKLLLPADMLTVKLYEKLSLGTFGNSTPLARYRPAAYVEAGMQRMTYKGAARSAVLPADFEILGSYTIEGTVDELVTDSFLGRTQTVLNWNGTAIGGDARLIGYAMTLKSGVKEQGGSVVVTPGQVRLIIKLKSGRTLTLQPFAVIAQPDANSDVPLYRFRFDANDSYIASSGGGSTATFAFEFLMPASAQPMSLLFKNVRTDVSAKSALASKTTEFPTRSARDESVRSQRLFASLGAGGSFGPLDTSNAITIASTGANSYPNVSTNPGLPYGMTINKSNKGSLQIDDSNAFIGGENTLTKDNTHERGLSRNLAIRQFGQTPSTQIVQITLVNSGTLTEFGSSLGNLSPDAPVTLVDARGQRYDAIGFVYEEGETVRLRFNPGKPIAKLSDAPLISQTKRDQTLVLIFRPSRGVTITSFALGNDELVHFGGDGLTLTAAR